MSPRSTWPERLSEGASLGMTLVGSSAALEGVQFVLNQWLFCSALSPSVGIQRFRNQRVEGSEACLTIISSDSLVEALLCVPTTLVSAGKKSWFLGRGELFHQGTQRSST